MASRLQSFICTSVFHSLKCYSSLKQAATSSFRRIFVATSSLSQFHSSEAQIGREYGVEWLN